MRDLEGQALLTTVIGSYPTDGLPARRAIQQAVEDQIAAGVELIGDGQVRGDMIALAAGRIPGFRQAADGVWEVEAALDLPAAPYTVWDYAFARERAGSRAEVKGVVTGPITLALACRVAPEAPYTAPHDPALILRLAEILAHEVAALVASGARVVQVDEPLLSRALDGRITPELASDALRDLAAMPRVPALHVCGDVRPLAHELLLLPFSVLAIENTRISNLDGFDREETEFAGTRICAGCVDSADARVESIAEVRDRVAAAAALVAPEQLWIAPDCGLRELPRAAAREKLRRMVQAVQDVRAAL